jgi:hypothetical protein
MTMMTATSRRVSGLFSPGINARSAPTHAARCVARHGVRSHSVPVELVGECSTPLV